VSHGAISVTQTTPPRPATCYFYVCLNDIPALSARAPGKALQLRLLMANRSSAAISSFFPHESISCARAGVILPSS
jgi:hypothetical protein